MSDKSDDKPSRLTGSSKSYNLDGDTAEFDPGALQVHEFSPEMRQQISATKLPRFKPRTPKLEPVPPAKKRLSQRFLRVVGVSEPVPLEKQGAVEEYEIARTEPTDENAREAPTVPATRAVAVARKAPAGPSRGSWQWALFGLCLAVGVICFWLTRPPSGDPVPATAPQVHAAKNETPGTPAATTGERAHGENAEASPQQDPASEAQQEPSHQQVATPTSLPKVPTRPAVSTLSRTPEAQSHPVAHAVAKKSAAPPEPKTDTPSPRTSTPAAEPQSVFDTAIRPPAARTRRN